MNRYLKWLEKRTQQTDMIPQKLTLKNESNHDDYE